MSEATECGRVALWAAGLCAVAFSGALLVALPRNREAVGGGLAAGVLLGAFATASWYVVAVCGMR